MTAPDGLDSRENLAYLEELLEEFQRDPAALPEGWQRTFESLEGPKAPPRPSFKPHSLFNPPAGNGHAAASPASLAPLIEAEVMQDRVDQMVRAYRVRGHMIARLDPLGFDRPRPEELDPEFYGFSEQDMDRACSSRTIKGPAVRTLREIIERLRNTYCRYIGAQFMHIDEFHVRQWLQERMEGSENRCKLSRTAQFRILVRLTEAVVFEEFIRRKFLGAKSFSLEGAESLIPLLDLAIEGAGQQGVTEVVIGMAHRGRLNVLANTLGKSPRRIFREFLDQTDAAQQGGGDVKYHLGYHGGWTTAGGHAMHLALCFNPSHLEFVNPVAMGRARASQDRDHDHEHRRTMLLLIHGDAAFAGEGVVQETLQLSQLPAYTVGGTIHVIVNNQLGFTTPGSQGRSSIYASAIGKMLQIPIFHVNGEDPESVAQVVQLALDFRREFQRDAIIDMWCYRRLGHNETDEPSFTQPLMYKAIQNRPSVRNAYLKRLLKLGDVTQDAGDEIQARLREHLEAELTSTQTGDGEPAPQGASPLGEVWRRYKGGPDASVPDPETGVSAQTLRSVLESTTRLPAGFSLHPKLGRLLEQRRAMARGEQPLDWAAGEAAAFGSLALEGTRVRMTGQDCERGTFSHRHAVLHDYETGARHCPLAHLAKDQAPVQICNSPLSETGVLGFEYGYSIAYPDALVIWEAQFGDFANAAQVIIDQFISSAEDKWNSLSGLVLLLPHGYEGQGPEHSSARLERFLQLCAEDNMQVAVPSTPAQMFHLLRRQAVRPWRKPLVVMTPKSLLRHPRCVSPLAELTQGGFRRVIGDETVAAGAVRRVLICAGKVYFDLLAEREKRQRMDVALVRLEQLYPLPVAALHQALAAYPADSPTLWVQEEPANMGAWPHLRLHRIDHLPDGRTLRGVARDESASPATGSHRAHQVEQARLLARAFGDQDE